MYGSDIKDAAEYGAEQIKNAIKEYFGKFIDKELAKEAEEKGWPQLQEAVNTIEGLPKRWQEINTSLHKLQQERFKTINQLAELLGNNQEGVLFKTINNYGEWYKKDPQELAKIFVDSATKMNTLSFGMGFRDEPVEEILGETITRQQKLSEDINNEGGRKAITVRDSKDYHNRQAEYKVELENPERAEIIIDEQTKCYRKFQATLTTPEEVSEKIRSRHNNLIDEINADSARNLVGESGKIPSHLRFDNKICEKLRERRLRDIKDDLQKQQKIQTEDTAKLKEQLNGKIERDWGYSEFSTFSAKNRDIIYEVERAEEKQKLIKELPFSLDSIDIQLQGQADELVSIDSGYRSYSVYFKSATNDDLRSLHSKMDNLKGKIEKIKKDIQSINERGEAEGDGLIGRKKRQREREIALLAEQNKPLLADLKKVQAEYQPKYDLNEKLNDLRTLINKADDKRIDLKIPQKTISLKELIDNVKKQMLVSITPEQSEIYEQYKILEKQQKQAEKNYEKWKR